MRDALKQSFEIKVHGRLGEGCTGDQEIRILNRIVAVDELGLRYEADPRHGDLLFSSLDLSASSSAATPGVKPVDRNANAEKSDEPAVPSLMDYSDPDSVINAILLGKYGDHTLDVPGSMADLGKMAHQQFLPPGPFPDSMADFGKWLTSHFCPLGRFQAVWLLAQLIILLLRLRSAHLHPS